MKYNEYWEVNRMGPRYYTARATDKNDLCRGERRIYYSKDAFDRDFPEVDFSKAGEPHDSPHPGSKPQGELFLHVFPKRIESKEEESYE